jgi:DNA-binding CsgD family transcriptional regulator
MKESWAHAVLDFWHIGVVAFSAAGEQLFANRAARRLMEAGDGLSLGIDGRIESNVRGTRALRELIHDLAEGTRTGPEWLRVSRPSGARPYEVALCRLRVADGSDARVAMFVAAPDTPVGVELTALRKLHGLTDLEAHVAECFVRGLPVQNIGETLGLSLQTARWYVQQVRQKIEAASQTDLLRLVLRSVTGIEMPADVAGTGEEK